MASVAFLLGNSLMFIWYGGRGAGMADISDVMIMRSAAAPVNDAGAEYLDH